MDRLDRGSGWAAPAARLAPQVPASARVVSAGPAALEWVDPVVPLLAMEIVAEERADPRGQAGGLAERAALMAGGVD